MKNYPYVITVSSEKGGVGKTTLAVNLAIYLRALGEDLPVTVFSFDNHFTVDRMFRLGKGPEDGSVADLLAGTPASSLVRTGEYGVSYIPSSSELSRTKAGVPGPMHLAQLLAGSDLPGVVIIDTRPDLDILTQNALYAADRVLIPVKDMASLENCRNIFDLFDSRGMNRKTLVIIPCLIDSRIKFEGPFKDQKELLKGYALNRGFRCLDTYVSKSPKVESLNTNPEGKIYPILTHARWTEVHGQFTQIARGLLREISATREPRALLFDRWMREEESRKNESYLARLASFRGECPLCGAAGEVGEIGYYYEASAGQTRGVAHERCFLGFLLQEVYGLDRQFGDDDPTWKLFLASSRESGFHFSLTPAGDKHEVTFRRFDSQGGILSEKQYPLSNNGAAASGLHPFYRLMTGPLQEDPETCSGGTLLFLPLPGEPEVALKEESFRHFGKIRRALAAPIPESAHNP